MEHLSATIRKEEGYQPRQLRKRVSPRYGVAILLGLTAACVSSVKADRPPAWQNQAREALIAGLPFQVTATDPAGGVISRSAPLHMTVTFSHPINALSLNASDLTIDGLPATGVSLLGPDKAWFDLPALGEGTHSVRIARGSIFDIQRNPVAAFATGFTLDLTPPRVVESSIQDKDTLIAGDLVCTITFSEPMLVPALEPSDILLRSAGPGAEYTPAVIGFDATATVLTVGYAALPAGDYTLTIADTAVTDLAGHHLDGEPAA